MFKIINKEKSKYEDRHLVIDFEENHNIIPIFEERNDKKFLHKNKEVINKKLVIKNDSISSTDNESDLSKKYLTENTNVKDHLSNERKNSTLKTSFSPNSAFKQMRNSISSISSPSIFNLFNYFLNTLHQMPCNNLAIKNYINQIFFNYLNSKFSSIYNSKINIPAKETPNKINFLNKKRKAEKTIKINPTKVLIKTLFKTDEKIKVKNQKTSLFQVIKKSSYKKRKKYLKRIEKNIKTNCSHFGCETTFRTKKQALYHHYKMSRECHEDTINLIKMISETKKILLKNIKENKVLLENYSNLYENSMKEISLSDYIDIITGFNITDKLN